MTKNERLEDRIRRNKSEIRNLKNILSNTEDEYEAEKLAADILSRQFIVIEARKEFLPIIKGVAENLIIATISAIRSYCRE